MNTLPIEKIVFVLLAVYLLYGFFDQIKKENRKTFAALFCFSLVCVMAFYLFEFSNLAEFSVQGLSAKAQFIRDKATQAEEDSQEIIKLKAESVANASQIAETGSSVTAIQERLEMLARTITPRSINEEQVVKFAQAVKPRPKGTVKIVSESPDGETLTYCFEIRQMLTDAGYPNEAQDLVAYPTFPTPRTQDKFLWIVYKSKDKVPPSLVPLLDGLAKIGIKAESAIDPSGQTGEGVLTIEVPDKYGH